MSIKLTKNKAFSIRGKIDGFYTTKVTAFGTGAKIGCEKGYMNRDVVVFILKEGEKI